MLLKHNKNVQFTVMIATIYFVMHENRVVCCTNVVGWFFFLLTFTYFFCIFYVFNVSCEQRIAQSGAQCYTLHAMIIIINRSSFFLCSYFFSFFIIFVLHFRCLIFCSHQLKTMLKIHHNHINFLFNTPTHVQH